MSVKATYTDFSDIPDALSEYYVERDGKYEIAIEGIKTSTDVSKLQESLQKERAAHKETKGKVRQYSRLRDLDMDIDEVLHRVDAYSSSTQGEVKELNTKVNTFERENKRLQRELNEANTSASDFSKKYHKTVVSSALQEAAVKAGVESYALEDVLMRASMFDISETGSVVTKETGLDPATWLNDLKDNKPHWFSGSNGMGAKGGKASPGGSMDNPFKAGNITQVMRLMKDNPGKADQLAQLAGFESAEVAASKNFKQ